MLVLSRKQTQKIILDGRIEVTVVKCGKGRVRLGISAPADVSVRRGELESRGDELPGKTQHGAPTSAVPDTQVGGPAAGWESVVVPVHGA